MLTLACALQFAGDAWAQEAIDSDLPTDPEVLQKEARTAMRQAITLLEEGKVELFLDRYAPYEGMRQLRLSGQYARSIALLKAKPTPPYFNVIRQTLTPMRDVTPKIDVDRMIATFVDRSGLPEPDEQKSKDEPAPIIAEFYEQTDPADVLTAAVSDLEAGRVATVLGKLYPYSILQAHAKAGEGNWKVGVQADAERLKELGQVKFRRGPAPLEQLEADFTAMQKVAPAKISPTRINYVLDAGTPKQRVLSLELVDGHWRLPDNTKKTFQEIGDPQPIVDLPTVQFIRIGGQWRMIDTQPRHDLDD